MQWSWLAIVRRPIIPHAPIADTTGVFLVILLAVIGYVLVTLPPQAGRQYTKPTQISPWVGYVYLAVVGIGSLLLAGLLLSILVHIWKNTRQKAADRERRT